MHKPLLTAAVLLAIVFVPAASRAIAPADTAAFIREKQEYIRAFMQDAEHVEGLSLALFTRDRIIWQESFGTTTYGRPVDGSTLFGLQSVSKNFTALAVLFAARDGLVDLDAPIIEYLPEFRVNSAFERAPEARITLRHLLAHTAGFTHEAPTGNNFDHLCPSNRDHWDSIRDTWLKFPVGSAYSYSNLGYDLAAEILERVSGMRFEDYMRRTVFDPLGMTDSTVDDRVFVQNPNRTEGRIASTVKKRHYRTPLIGSGAVYSSVDEMIRYVRFHLDFGRSGGRQLLEREYLQAMYTPVTGGYGLGITAGPAVNDEHHIDTYYLNHNGGGFGYGATMTWVPEYGIGVVALGYGPHDYSSVVIDEVLFDCIARLGMKSDTAVTGGFSPLPRRDRPDGTGSPFVFPDDPPGEGALDDEEFDGTYGLVLRGREYTTDVDSLPVYEVVVRRQGDGLSMTGCLGDHSLREYLPGLFFTDGGEALDLRRKPVRFRNIELRRLR